MASSFEPGDTTERGDLTIFLEDSDDNPTNAYEITYAIYLVDVGPPEAEVLIGSATRTPENPIVGEYYAHFHVPSTAQSGTYRIKWTFKQNAGSTVQLVAQEFTVVGEGQLSTVGYSAATTQLIRDLRILIRDQAPDQFYHFRPPEHEARIGSYNRIFGRVWEDYELELYLRMGLDWWNMEAPRTFIPGLDQLVQQQAAWRTPVFWSAVHWAMFALAVNWVQDEFSYSIGGVSLDISKADKFQSLAELANGRMESAKETKKETVKYIKGLSQPRFGIGLTSAMGPRLGRGVLSPRSYI
jgi:hypothetical protein